MDYNMLLDLATDLGYELAINGAETFRVEDSINRILHSYGVQSEVFAIPNCLTVSIETPDGQLMTRMRRIGYHGTDLDGVESYNGLSRAICNRKPDPAEGQQWLRMVHARRRRHSGPVFLLGYFLGASGFAVFFGGTLLDALWAGLCGILLGIVGRFMDSLKANQFFSTISSSFLMALLAYCIAGFGLTDNVDTVIIGALMILVPGLLFTNAMRDIIFGDTNSGVNRIVQVLLIAMGIALGTVAAWSITGDLWPHITGAETVSYSLWVQCLASFIGCVGFSILYNVHSLGIPLCSTGGMLTWAVYLIASSLGAGVIAANFWAALFCSAYAEAMARIRKFPAITYLVVSVFPLLPGAGIYYTVSYALGGSMERALSKGLETIGIAGSLAVGILLVSTAVRLFHVWRAREKE